MRRDWVPRFAHLMLDRLIDNKVPAMVMIRITTSSSSRVNPLRILLFVTDVVV
jgi:hypothetical protein